MCPSIASKKVSRAGSLLKGGVQMLLERKGLGLVCGGKSCVNVFTESHAAAETVKWSQRLTLFFSEASLPTGN